MSRAVTRAIIGGLIFISSCSAKRISFEIDCLTIIAPLTYIYIYIYIYRVYKKNEVLILRLIISKLLKLIAQFWTCFKPRSFLFNFFAHYINGISIKLNKTCYKALQKITDRLPQQVCLNTSNVLLEKKVSSIKRKFTYRKLY